MKTLNAVLILFLFACSQAYAVTVWYQPTPYPLKMWNDTPQNLNPMPQDLNIVHAWGGNLYYCSWCNNNAGVTNFTRSDQLRTGGWGDRYDPFLRFDLKGLPTDVTFAAVYLMPFYVGGTPTPFAFCSVDSYWDLSMIWNTRPSRTCYGYYAAPTPGNWWGFDITPWYNGWKNNTKFDGGISIFPQNTNNNFNAWRSPVYADYVNDPYADGRRPILRLDFTPTLELKMPLPGGYSWLLTNEIGGYECMGQAPWPDTYHADSTNNYFSVDFSSRSSPTYSGSIPILAAAGGKVVQSTYNSGNGNYIVVDHDGDGVSSTGYQTWYLHLVNPAAKKNGTALVVGSVVQQGDQIGIMGTTGISTGVHLHFGIRYKNVNLSSTPELTKVVMDGKVLKSYQTECSLNGNGVPLDWARYYSSGNVPTGN